MILTKQEEVYMKWMVRKGIYQASNVTFDPETCEAYSYGWWKFVGKIGGKIVFNTYSYSNTTIKHQLKVRSLLRDLDLWPDYELEVPGGLQSLHTGAAYYHKLIEELQAEIAIKGSHKAKNLERQKRIKELKVSLAVCKALEGCL